MSDDDQHLGKIANLLALIVTQDMARSTAATTLASCGFSNREIAALTGSAENSVRAMLSAAKRKAPAKASAEASDG